MKSKGKKEREDLHNVVGKKKRGREDCVVGMNPLAKGLEDSTLLGEGEKRGKREGKRGQKKG